MTYKNLGLKSLTKNRFRNINKRIDLDRFSNKNAINKNRVWKFMEIFMPTAV